MTSHQPHRTAGRALAAALALTALASAAVSAAPALVSTDLFVPEGDAAGYKSPALVVTKNGVVLAFASKKIGRSTDYGVKQHFVLRRSTDGGKTWGPEQVVPKDGFESTPLSPVADLQTGKVLVIGTVLPVEYASRRKVSERWLIGSGEEARRAGGRIVIFESTDDGATWGNLRHLTRELWSYPRASLAICGGHGAQISSGPNKGRLVVPGRHFGDASKTRIDADCRNHVILSDDGGESWRFGGRSQEFTSGASIAALANGDIYMTCANYDSATEGLRAFAASYDGGRTFETAGADESHKEKRRAAASVVGYPFPGGEGEPALLFSNPAGAKGLRELTVRASNDYGKTWPEARLIDEGFAADSDLAVTPDGTILCLYETTGYKVLKLAMFNREWIKAGE